MTIRSNFALTLALAVQLAGVQAAPSGTMSNPDFTKGDPIPDGATHDWNLGATGARGWMFSDKMVTSDARQIRITQVAEGSPADGVLASGDVILGVGGKPFSYDPRTEFGRALSAAETGEGAGKLSLLRWRGGQEETVTVSLPVLGNYAATAPYDCPKSKVVLERGCEALAAKVAAPGYRANPITRSLNALALLASGDPQYLPQVRQEAKWAAGYSATRMQTWYYGYVMLFLAEYVLATGDQAVLPDLRRLALEAADGQSIVGSWGHRFANPDGRLGGYGMMNSPGVPLTTALLMAKAAGVDDPAVAEAIERSAKLIRFYIGKGAIPYGDHAPWIENHEDNGKCGMAAVLFNLLNEPGGAEYFSRMSVASHGPERDTGHTGNFFNLLWAMPGVAPSGPQATGAWMKEFGSWYYDLARGWDGSFSHQGPPAMRHDSYNGWDCSGAYLLAYAMPLKKIYLTGKRPSIVPPLGREEAERLIADGRGWNNKDRRSAYDRLTVEQLLGRLESWSPIVRERSAMALGRRKDVPVEPLIGMLDSTELYARLGACQGLGALRGRAAPAVAALRQTLDADDLWLRVKAAEALAAIGKPALGAAPQLLELLAEVDVENDPRGMQQRYLSFALFNQRGGMLSRSLEGVDRELLFKAVRAGLKNEDGRARGSFGSVYRNLSFEEIGPLLPAIYQAVIEPAPSGVMFAAEIRVEGLRVLAKHRVAEGIDACANYVATQNPWASEKRTPELMKILLQYGASAKPAIPKLQKIAADFADGEKDFPRRLSQQKAAAVLETIRAIEASDDEPELIRISG